MDSEESKQLKDLITAFRDCKTANEERHLIQREKAIIRNSFIVVIRLSGQTRTLSAEEYRETHMDQHAGPRDGFRAGSLIHDTARMPEHDIKRQLFLEKNRVFGFESFLQRKERRPDARDQ